MTSPLPSSPERRRRARWRAASERLTAVSPTLGRRFSEHTAALLPHVDVEVLEACARAGVRLRAEAGWRGERLALVLFEVSHHALPLLAADDVERWMALAFHCAGELEEEAFLRALPAAIAGWEAGERVTWLEAARGLPPALALATYRELPLALERLSATLRPRFLAAWQAAAAGGPRELAEVVPLLPALLTAVPDVERGGAVAIIEQVADEFPAGLSALLRSLPRLYESAGAERVRA